MGAFKAKTFRNLFTSCIGLIFILIGTIVYLYYSEWIALEELEKQNRLTNKLQEDINDFNVILSEFSLSGESFLNWDDCDKEEYCKQYVYVDSVLQHFNIVYKNESIDSIGLLLKYKTNGLLNIANVFAKQKDISDKISLDISALVKKSTLQQPREQKRKGILGIFGKKKKNEPTITTSMLRSFNRNVISQHVNHQYRLTELADSLMERNLILNKQLNKVIHQLEEKVRENIRQRENEILFMRERSYRQMGGLTIFLIVLLVLSYTSIIRDIRQKERVKRKLEESISQNCQLLEMRKKIILTISHDIRGPLTVISGSAELAIDTRDKKKRDSYLKNARYLCRHVVHLLNNLLDVYRLNEAKETPNNVPFRLNILLGRIAAGAEQVINDKGLLFIHNFRNVDVTVSGDEDRIEQIADNLLSNAVKFTKSGTVGITAEYSDGKLSMEIRDTGMGMTEETVGRIFNPFERADNVDHVEGFGLGLPITKGLVSLLGGTIDVVSNVGKGSMFHVVIPLPEADSSCIPNPPAEKPTGKLHLPSSVLVVDDDPMQCGIVREMLERNSVSCTVCTTVSGVVKAMRESDYDILLTDINMPGTNGFALLELLRKSTIGNSRDIPVIAMTARDDEDNRTLLGHGFSGCIFKPFSMQELLERISIVNVRCKMVADVDLSMLTADVVNKTGILRTLIDTTESDKSALKTAVADNNRKAIGNILHRMYSMWTMLHLETELQALRTAVKDKKTSAENIKALSDRVINVMEILIENAKEEMEALKYEEQDFDR